ncbi:MAG: putative bifunctional diguanylate cyclase/phosphodiesterase [Alphaproteobacteria bacterium]
MSSSHLLSSTTLQLEDGGRLRLGEVFDGLFLFAGVLNVDGVLLDVNRAPLEIAALDAGDVIGLPFWDAWWWSYDEGVRARIREGVELAGAGRTVRFAVRGRGRGAARLLVDLQMAPLYDDGGRIRYLLASALNVSAREDEARRHLRELQVIYDRAPVGLGVIDCDRRVVRLNQRLAELEGGSVDALVGRSLWDLFPGLRRELEPACERVFAAGEAALGLELTGDTASAPGGLRHWLIHLYPVAALSGAIDGVGLICEDITERKRTETQLVRSRREIEHQALHDALTGLPNRALLSDRARQQIARVRREGGTMALLMMDLDDFKGVNDTLGHAAGDALLEQVGARLAGAVREVDTVGRLGGDEFAVVTGALRAAEDAAVVAERILAALAEPISLLGRPHLARASVGVALYPGDAHRLGGLFRCADLAMYEAKAAGGARAMFFEPEMHEQLRARQQLERALRRAVDERALELRPLPRHAVADLALAAWEAEIVWRHPERGVVPIEADLVFAERKGLGAAIAARTLEQAFAFIDAPGRRAATTPLCVAFSPTQLADPRIVDALLDGLDRGALAGDRLQVELLTGVAWGLDGDDLVATLTRLAARGVNIGLRGFGADHVAFHELRHLPLDSLILAGELVRDLGRRDEAEAFVDALAGLGRRLNKRVVARGVETETQLELLRRAGCEQAAGPLFAGAAWQRPSRQAG